ncbi:hypothetical protein MTP99_017618 [Tenebrio molitor]|nr:hypothetical protein MTP99_017618 [Tenebrio molitor]
MTNWTDGMPLFTFEPLTDFRHQRWIRDVPGDDESCETLYLGSFYPDGGLIVPKRLSTPATCLFYGGEIAPCPDKFSSLLNYCRC